MNIWILYFIMAGGLVWLLFCLEKGWNLLIYNIKKGDFSAALKNKPLKDLFVSILFMWIGKEILMGVSGMCIGLIASIIASIFIQIRRKK